MPNDKWWPAKRDKMTQHNLKKTVTFVQAIAIVVGMIIGSGIFLKPSIVFHNAGSPMLGLLAWIIGGISFDPGKRFGGNLYFFRHLQYPYGSFGIRAVDLFRVRRFRGFYTEKKKTPDSKSLQGSSLSDYPDCGHTGRSLYFDQHHRN